MHQSQANQLTIEALMNLVSKPTYLGDASVTPGLKNLYLALSHELNSDVFLKAGLALHRDFKTLPLPYVEATPELLEILARRGVYGSEPRREGSLTPSPLGHYYSLEVLGNGRVLVRYSQIIGSWCIGTLSAEQISQLTDVLSDELKKHHEKVKASSLR